MADTLKLKFDELNSLINSEMNIVKRQKLAQEQIEILKQIQENVLILAQQRGLSVESYSVLDIKLQQYKLMRKIAAENNLQVEQFDQLVKETELKIFGE